MKIIIAVLLSFILAACAGQPAGPNAPSQAVYQIKSDYDAALQVAIAYAQLPRCGSVGNPPLCSQAKVVVQLDQASQAAGAAIQAAENTVRDPNASDKWAVAASAARNALTALTAITATLQVKP